MNRNDSSEMYVLFDETNAGALVASRPRRSASRTTARKARRTAAPRKRTPSRRSGDASTASSRSRQTKARRPAVTPAAAPPSPRVSPPAPILRARATDVVKRGVEKPQGFAKGAARPLDVTEPAALEGLCRTCVFASECTLRRRSAAGIYQCEEFDDRGAPGELALEGADVTRTVRAGVVEPAAAPRTQPRAEPVLRGLCVNCEYRFTCTHPRPESGVWHCEDFA